MATVPVTPAVVAWAVEESGYSLDEIAEAVGTQANAVAAWIAGKAQPSVTQARKLAQKLRRPLALFLWSTPPTDDSPSVAFRAPVVDEMRDLNPVERRYIRQAARIQRIVRWLIGELDLRGPTLPQADVKSDPKLAGKAMRDYLDISLEAQTAWRSEYVALKAWRERCEERGIMVFLLPLGEDSCRGISLADAVAPAVIINTHWNVRARIFTLFHEIGHVLTQTTSACAASRRHSIKGDVVERWCEQFAAATLMPWDAIERKLDDVRAPQFINDLSIPGAIAQEFSVSLQASTLRLINERRARWTLWDKIPKDDNAKRKGGKAPDEPRTTPVVRLHEIGRRPTAVLLTGMSRGVIDRSQVASTLRVGDNDLSDIERRMHGGGAVDVDVDE
ncbi:MAG: XRE family transcriptional regulator [Deltaproteobacteria bacterium]|nr:XRE family transcriptional regulator [Kofleriaceae bacterium]